MRPMIRSLFVPSALAVLLLSACNSSLDSNPTFQKQVKQVGLLEEDVKALSRQFTVFDSEYQQMRGEFQQVSRDVANVVTGGVADSPEGVRALEQRLLRMEASLQEANDAVAALQKRLESYESRTPRTASGDAAPAAPTRSISTRSAQPESKASAPAPASAPRTVHMIAPGETIESIAESYAVPAERLRAINHIPAGKNVAAGQRIFIPN